MRLHIRPKPHPSDHELSQVPELGYGREKEGVRPLQAEKAPKPDVYPIRNS